MKDWPRPGTSHSPTHTHTYSHSHSPSLGPSPSHRYSPVPSPAFNSTFSLALCNPCSTGNCRHCSCFLFFFSSLFFCCPVAVSPLFLVADLLHCCFLPRGRRWRRRGAFSIWCRRPQQQNRIVNFAFVWSLPNALATLQVKWTPNGTEQTVWREGLRGWARAGLTGVSVQL